MNLKSLPFWGQLLVAIVFAVQNTDTTQVQFLAWESEGSLALVLLIALAAGALISYFVSLPAKLRDKLTIRSQGKKIDQLEGELGQLKEQQSQLKDAPEITTDFDKDEPQEEKKEDEAKT